MEQQIRFCTTSDGVRIAYATMGAGPPVVRALGWLTHLEFELEGPIWRSWHDHIAGRHQFIRYDGRGIGLSDRAVSDFSLEAKVRDLEAVVDVCALPRFALLGTSEGSAAALTYAVRHPERVSHLILYGVSARSAGDAISDEALAALRALIHVGWGQGTPAFEQLFTSVFYPDADAAFIRWFNELQRAAATPELAATFTIASLKIDVEEILPRVATPTLVIHRRGDASVPFENGRELAAAIPGARFLPLEGRNHFPLPGEPETTQLFQAIEDFLTEPDSVDAQPDGLSAREIEVLRLLAAGLSNQQIAARLVISPNTVIRHVSNIFDKTGVANRAEAATYANRHGLVE